MEAAFRLIASLAALGVAYGVVAPPVAGDGRWRRGGRRAAGDALEPEPASSAPPPGRTTLGPIANHNLIDTWHGTFVSADVRGPAVLDAALHRVRRPQRRAGSSSSSWRSSSRPWGSASPRRDAQEVDGRLAEAPADVRGGAGRTIEPAGGRHAAGGPAGRRDARQTYVKDGRVVTLAIARYPSRNHPVPPAAADSTMKAPVTVDTPARRCRASTARGPRCRRRAGAPRSSGGVAHGTRSAASRSWASTCCATGSSWSMLLVRPSRCC